MSSTYQLISSPRQPQWPLLDTGLRMREASVPSGVVSLKGKMKPVIFQKLGPVWAISRMMSSRQMMSPPRYCSTCALDLICTRSSPFLPQSFLQMSSLTSFLEGSPQVMQFSTLPSCRMLARVPLRKTAVLMLLRPSLFRMIFCCLEMSVTPRTRTTSSSLPTPEAVPLSPLAASRFSSLFQHRKLLTLSLQCAQDFCCALYCLMNFSGALRASLFFLRLLFMASLLRILLSTACWSFLRLRMMSVSTYYFLTVNEGVLDFGDHC